MARKSKQDIYDKLVRTHNLPVFYQPWYLNCVCQEGLWDVAMITNDSEVLGIWPYYLKSRWGMTYMTMPPLTPYLGPVIFKSPHNIGSAAMLSYEKKVLYQLVEELPEASWHICHAQPSFKNWQPLSWKRYRQTTRYTLRLDLTKSTEALQNTLVDKTRSQIRSCQKRVKVKKSSEDDELYSLVKKTYDRQNRVPPVSAALFQDLYLATTNAEALMSYTAYDRSAPVAFVSTIEDHDTAYLTITGRGDNAPPFWRDSDSLSSYLLHIK